MGVRRLAVGLIVGGLAQIGLPAAWAQTSSSTGSPASTASTASTDPAPQPPSTAAAASDPQIDPAKIGVSLDRIRAKLVQAHATKFSGLKIEETVEVVGKAPKLPLWKDEDANLAHGPVPYGAPTHKDFYVLNTPQAYRTPAVDINALVQWLLEVLNKKPE